MKTAENDSFVLLQDALSFLKTPGGEPLINSTIPFHNPVVNGLNKDYIEIIFGSEVPVLCVNRREKKKRNMAFGILYHNNKRFWQNKGNWQFYLAQDELTKIKNKVIDKPDIWQYGVNSTEDMQEKQADGLQSGSLEITDTDDGFGSDYKAVSSMTIAEQLQLLNTQKQLLGSLIINNNQDVEVVTKALVETTRDTALVNYSVLQGAMQLVDDEAKEVTHDLVKSTCDISKLSAHLVSHEVFDNELMNTLVKKSNGTIIQHITRVYLNGLAFLSFYNKLVSTTSIIKKLRCSFASKYHKYYASLLPYIDIKQINLERVFLNGMRAISTDLFFKWAVGFLLHDIGKAASVEYHEGAATYNRDIVTQHVILGYDSVMHKTNYPREVGPIVGYHHEYYGDKDGYGYFRNCLDQYKKENHFVKPYYCISYELEPLIDYEANAYFPAKILEIIDIYDSITDPNRKYHKAMSPEEALDLMREDFIDKHYKIDVILFDIFCLYIQERQRQLEENAIKEQILSGFSLT